MKQRFAFSPPRHPAPSPSPSLPIPAIPVLALIERAAAKKASTTPWRNTLAEAAQDTAWVPVMEKEIHGASGSEVPVVKLEDEVPVLLLGPVDREEALPLETYEAMARQVRNKLMLEPYSARFRGFPGGEGWSGHGFASRGSGLVVAMCLRWIRVEEQSMVGFGSQESCSGLPISQSGRTRATSIQQKQGGQLMARVGSGQLLVASSPFGGSAPRCLTLPVRG